ncbi:MAG: NAD(P)H-dependent glycerol-3-phosphate dehydrogenase [Solirubrobacteraceae bacterium]|nr:glycerol-3-phosphate dehydrogenase [Patulibacter sp.]
MPSVRQPRAASRSTITSLVVPNPIGRRAIVVGAGSFGTAIAVLLARGGLRTTLQTRSEEQAERLRETRENEKYLPGVELPADLRIESVDAGLSRGEIIFLGLPSSAVTSTVSELESRGLRRRVPIVAMSKGLVPPDGQLPSRVLAQRFGPLRVAAIGGPAHAQEMVADGAALVVASENENVANLIQQVFLRAGVVCERTLDPVGVELGGVAKNAAALAAGATEAQGLNAAGAAAGHIFAEVWDYAARLGARPQSLLGLAGVGDLVATALAPHSRNRRAGELLAAGVPSEEIPIKVGQAVEALETVPLLARALALAGVQAPVTSGLAQLIAGELPLADWTQLVRTTVPSTSRWRGANRRAITARMRESMRFKGTGSLPPESD